MSAIRSFVNFSGEIINSHAINILNRRTFIPNIIPCAPHLLQDELLQGNSRQFLLRRTRTIVAYAMFQVLVVPRLLELYYLRFSFHAVSFRRLCHISFPRRAKPWFAALERAQDFLPFLPRRFLLIGGQRFNLHLAA